MSFYSRQCNLKAIRMIAAVFFFWHVAEVSCRYKSGSALINSLYETAIKVEECCGNIYKSCVVSMFSETQ